jgi:hypothetical protein
MIDARSTTLRMAEDAHVLALAAEGLRECLEMEGASFETLSALSEAAGELRLAREALLMAKSHLKVEGK